MRWRYPVTGYDLDGLLALLFAFMRDEEAEMQLPLPLSIDAHVGSDQAFDRWAVASAIELRWLLAEGLEVFLHVTAPLRGRNDDLPSVCGAPTVWDVETYVPPGVSGIKPYHDQYGLLVRIDGDDLTIGAGWRGFANGIVPLAQCAEPIAAGLTELVESFVRNGGTWSGRSP